MNGQKFALVFQVDVNGSVAISNGKLGAAAKIDGSHHAAALRVNNRRAVRIAIHHKDALREGIVNDAVGVLVSLRFAGHLEALQIENDRLALRAVTDEAAAKLAGHGDPVILLQSGDVRD